VVPGAGRGSLPLPSRSVTAATGPTTTCAPGERVGTLWHVLVAGLNFGWYSASLLGDGH
jgi:hypothetical protein